MHKCSLTSHLEIVQAGLAEYNQLARFHYRDGRLGAYAAIFALKESDAVHSRNGEIAGVIVYSMPAPALELRSMATGGLFKGFCRAAALQLVNENIRCISRVIIEPRYRGLGLASRLVAETMPRMDMPIIESMAVMGRINPFFEKAGMKRYSAKKPCRCVQMVEAFSMVGIEDKELIDPAKVQKKLDSLGAGESQFIERQIRLFLQCYGKRRAMKPGLERTRFVLSKLTFRPVYYIWLNPEKKITNDEGRKRHKICFSMEMR